MQNGSTLIHLSMVTRYMHFILPQSVYLIRDWCWKMRRDCLTRDHILGVTPESRPKGKYLLMLLLFIMDVLSNWWWSTSICFSSFLINIFFSIYRCLSLISYRFDLYQRTGRYLTSMLPVSAGAVALYQMYWPMLDVMVDSEGTYRLVENRVVEIKKTRLIEN